jgi:hypothetical protein
MVKIGEETLREFDTASNLSKGESQMLDWTRLKMFSMTFKTQQNPTLSR